MLYRSLYKYVEEIIALATIIMGIKRLNFYYNAKWIKNKKNYCVLRNDNV